VPPGETSPRPCWGNGAVVNPAQFTAGFRGPGCNLQCHGFNMQINYTEHSVTGGTK
jgi:hypothetical protein